MLFFDILYPTALEHRWVTSLEPNADVHARRHQDYVLLSHYHLEDSIALLPLLLSSCMRHEQTRDLEGRDAADASEASTSSSPFAPFFEDHTEGLLVSSTYFTQPTHLSIEAMKYWHI
jgi:hypothetical protein